MNSLTALIASAILAASLTTAPSSTSDEIGLQQFQTPPAEEESYPVGPPTTAVTEE